jgi:hypothetical protein
VDALCVVRCFLRHFVVVHWLLPAEVEQKKNINNNRELLLTPLLPFYFVSGLFYFILNPASPSANPSKPNRIESNEK